MGTVSDPATGGNSTPMSPKSDWRYGEPSLSIVSPSIQDQRRRPSCAAGRLRFQSSTSDSTQATERSPSRTCAGKSPDPIFRYRLLLDRPVRSRTSLILIKRALRWDIPCLPVSVVTSNPLHYCSRGSRIYRQSLFSADPRPLLRGRPQRPAAIRNDCQPCLTA